MVLSLTDRLKMSARTLRAVGPGIRDPIWTSGCGLAGPLDALRHHLGSELRRKRRISCEVVEATLNAAVLLTVRHAADRSIVLDQ